MLRRYPHTATLVVNVESENCVENHGIPEVKKESFEIVGRFEPSSSKSDNIDYKAKYYCKNFQDLLRRFIDAGFIPDNFIAPDGKENLKPFSVDGQTLTYNDKDFEIILLHNYQTHCEIWLE